MAKKESKQPSSPRLLSVQNLGQIEQATVEFGDFTLLVGAQASGKSLFLQMLKLVVDRRPIHETLRSQGFEWNSKLNGLLELYFGESMSGIWRRDETTLTFDKKKYTEPSLASAPGKPTEADKVESIFYIPAQRVLTIAQGWPRNFQSFEIGDPYVLKAFSESLRLLMEREFSNGRSSDDIFPKPGKMGDALKKRIEASIFHGATVQLDKDGLKRRFLQKIGSHGLPFMTWSAGQKEFMPLLLSLYHLIPSGGFRKREDIEWVVIEEPEMGLHPHAIQTILLLVLQLMERGYKVVISTHSPVLLEMVWAIRAIQKAKGEPKLLAKLFAISRLDDAMKKIFQTAIEGKSFRTWHFGWQSNGKVRAQDISALDADSENPSMANWGGLSEFASRAVDIVASLPQTEELETP